MKTPSPRILKYLLCFLPALMWAPNAWADEFLKYIQITCIPELNYFALHTINYDNLQIGEPDDKKTGLYTADDLMKNPYVCELPATRRMHKPSYTITAKITDYVPGRGDGGGCSLDHFGVSIELDGKKIHQQSLFRGSCAPEYSDLIEADFWTLRACEFSEYKSEQSKCEITELKH